MQMDFQPIIKGIARMILSLLAQLGIFFARQIKDAELKTMAVAFLESTSKAIEKLSDANPNDKEQLRQVLNDLVTLTEFRNAANEEITAAIAKLSNEQVRTVLLIINSQAFPIADLLTDNNKDNTEQIKEKMADLLQAADGIALFNNLLSLILPPAIATAISLVIVQALISVLDQDGDDAEKMAKIRQLREMEKMYSAAA
jgi:hypothetical protein